MTVKELKKVLDNFDENLEVVIGVYDQIAEEDGKVFNDIDGVEQLTSDWKEEFVCINFYN